MENLTMPRTKKESDKVIVNLKNLVEVRKNDVYQYGEVSKIKGDVLSSLFPNGSHLESSDQYSRFAMVDMIVNNLIGYCNNFDHGGHEDCLNQISICSQMLNELDSEIKE